MKKGELITLKRIIPAYGKNPNTELEIIGIEEAIMDKMGKDVPLFLYQLSQIHDITPSLLLPFGEFPIFDATSIIGEIVSFNDDSVTFKSILDIDLDYENKKVLFAYSGDVDKEAGKFNVKSLNYAYIMIETQEEYLHYIEDIKRRKDKENNILFGGESICK